MTPEERADSIRSLVDFPHPLDSVLRIRITNEIRAAIAEEREACAKIAEYNPNEKVVHDPTNPDDEIAHERVPIARAIRARG